MWHIIYGLSKVFLLSIRTHHNPRINIKNALNNRAFQFVDKRGSELKNSEPLLKFP